MTFKLSCLNKQTGPSWKVTGEISTVSLPFLCWPPAVGRRSCPLESRRRSRSHTQPPDHRHLLGQRSTAPRSRSSDPQIWAEVDLKKETCFYHICLAQLYSISSGPKLVECTFKTSRIRRWINQDEHLFLNSILFKRVTLGLI